jgi:hypothetical protein
MGRRWHLTGGASAFEQRSMGPDRPQWAQAEAIQAAKAAPDDRAWISVDEIAKIQASANMPAAVATFDLACNWRATRPMARLS